MSITLTDIISGAATGGADGPLQGGGYTANSIQEFYRKGYANTIRINAMQMESRMENAVDVEDIIGESMFLDSYGRMPELFERSAVAERNAWNVDASVDRFRRQFSPRFFEFTENFDPRDETRLIRTFRPDGNYGRVVVSAFMRLKDCIILEAQTTDPLDGDGVAITMDASHVITKLGTPAGIETFLNPDDIAEVSALLQKDEAQMNEPWYVAIHPTDLGYLLRIREDGTISGTNVDPRLISFDFNALRPLMTGQVTQYYGFNWIVTPMLSRAETLSAGTGAYIRFFTQSATVYGRKGNVEVYFDVIPHRGHALQVAHYMQCTAVRMHEDKTVLVEAYDAP